jgi:hypothetical protein
MPILSPVFVSPPPVTFAIPSKQALPQVQCTVLDKVQQYCCQRDHRIGREDVLKIGTAATAILLEDCLPSAFDL